MKDFLFKHNAIEYVIEDKENEKQKKLTYEKWRMERHKFFPFKKSSLMRNGEWKDTNSF